MRKSRLHLSVKRVLSSFCLAASLLALVSTSFAQTCAVAAGAGTKADDWDDYFTQNGPGAGLEPAGSAGWTGGDSTYSLLLPGGDTAFFFSDSYIAESPRVAGDGTVATGASGLRTRQPNCLPPVCSQAATIHTANNSIVVRSADGKKMTTKVGPKNEQGFSTSYFKPSNPNRFYWLGDAAVVRTGKGGARKIWIFLFEWETNQPGEKWRLDFHGASIAELDAATLEIESVRRLKNIGNTEGHWGAALWLDESGGKEKLYIYGVKTVDGKKKPFVARVDPRDGLDRIEDVRNWSFWNGKSWVKSIAQAVSLVPAGDSISDELSVKRFSVGGQTRYLMVSLDTGVDYFKWKNIYLYSACAPQGPFADKNLVYTTPETGTRKLPGMSENQKLENPLVIYNPHLHPQFTANGELLISYNSNLPFGSTPGDTLFADVYRPRFIRVPVKGLK